MRRRRVAAWGAIAGLVAALVAGCDPQQVLQSGTVGTNAQVGQVKIRNVHLRATEDGYQAGESANARFYLFNESREQDALVDVRSPRAEDVVLRWDRGCDGRAEVVPRIPVTAAGTVPAAPGTDESATPYYLEIKNLAQLARPGTTFPLTFTFEKAGEVALDAKVQATRDGDRPPPSPCLGASTAPEPPAPTSPVPGAGEDREITVSGPVELRGGGCLLLAAEEGRPYVLLGGDPAVLRPGTHVVVRGRLEPGAVTCAHGAALRVLDVLPK